MVSRGDVFWADLEPKRRPVLVLTRDRVADRIGRLTVASITTRARHLPTEVALDPADGMPQPCVVSLDNVITIRRGDLRRHLTTLSPSRMDEVCRALVYALGCE